MERESVDGKDIMRSRPIRIPVINSVAGAPTKKNVVPQTSSTTTINAHNLPPKIGATHYKDRSPMLSEAGRYDSYRPDNNRSFRENSYRPQDRQQVGPSTQTNKSTRRLPHHTHHLPHPSIKRPRSRSPARSPVMPLVRPAPVEPQSSSQPYDDSMHYCHHAACPRNRGKGFVTAAARDAHIVAMHNKHSLHETNSKKHFCAVPGCKKTESEGFPGFVTILARDAHLIDSHKLEQSIPSKPVSAVGKPFTPTEPPSRKRAWSPGPPRIYFCRKPGCKRAVRTDDFRGFATIQALDAHDAASHNTNAVGMAPGALPKKYFCAIVGCKRAAPEDDFQGFTTTQARDAHMAACDANKEVKLRRLVAQLGTELQQVQALYQKVKTVCDEFIKESSETSRHDPIPKATTTVQGSSLDIPVGPRNSLPSDKRHVLPINLKHSPPTGPRFGNPSPSLLSRHRDSPAPVNRSESTPKLDEGGLHPARRQRLDNWEGEDGEPEFERDITPLRITGSNAMHVPRKSTTPMADSRNGTSEVNAKVLGSMFKQSTDSVMEDAGPSPRSRAMEATPIPSKAMGSTAMKPAANDCTCSPSPNHSRTECPVVCKQFSCFQTFSANKKTSVSFDAMHKAMLCNNTCAICGEDGPYTNSRTGHSGVHCPKKSCVCGQKHLLQSCNKVCGACAKVGCRSHCQNCGMRHHIEGCFKMKTLLKNQSQNQPSTTQVEVEPEPDADISNSRNEIQTISRQTPYEDHVMEDVRLNERGSGNGVNMNRPSSICMEQTTQDTYPSTNDGPASRSPKKFTAGNSIPEPVQPISNYNKNPQQNQNMLIAGSFGNSDFIAFDNPNAQSSNSDADNSTNDPDTGEQVGIQHPPNIDMATGEPIAQSDIRNSNVESGSSRADDFLRSLEDLLELPEITNPLSQRGSNGPSTWMGSTPGHPGA